MPYENMFQLEAVRVARGTGARREEFFFENIGIVRARAPPWPHLHDESCLFPSFLFFLRAFTPVTPTYLLFFPFFRPFLFAFSGNLSF